MSSAKTQVAVAPNVSTLAASQIQKEYSTDDSLNRQNSFGSNRRGNMKGKHLTRSHAMRESTSPPRTPTPRNEQQLSSPNGQAINNNNYSNNSQQHHQQQHHEPNEHSNSNNHNNSNKLHAQSPATTATSSSPLLETPSVIVTSQHSQQQQQKQNVVICNEADFPKLTPPKSSKSPRNNNNNNNNSSHSNNNGGGGNNNHNHRDLAEKSNNSVAGGGGDINNTKLEYNSNAKKSPVDNNNKAHANNNNSNNSTHNNGNNNNNSSNMNSKSHHQPYSSTSGATAMQLALNVSDATGGKQQQQQQTATAATSTTSSNIIYNSSMNYQLKPDVNTAQHQSHPQQPQHCGSNSNMYDKENRCPRNDSQNSSNSMSHDENQINVGGGDNHYERAGGGGGGGGGNNMLGQGGGPKKHRTTSNSKCTKPRLKTMGSSSSMDGGNSNSTSGFISRDSSMEQFTDQSGIDLLTFFKETLNKNPKDRNTLMKIEKDLVELAQDKTRSELRFPATSSYNRMLIHRTAAFFGMEHNVDAETQQCVIVAVTKGTRIPEIRFKTLFRDRMTDEPRKSILKRDTHSFDDARQSSYLCPDRGMLDRKAKSFEEREEDYEKARRRIFRNQQQQQQQQAENAECEESYMSWSSSVEQQQQQQSRMRPSGKMLKVQTSTESRDGRAVGVTKTNSFNSYGVPPSSGGPPLMRGDSNKSSGSSRSFSKQDSMGSASTPWRLSPSSSGSIYHFDPSNLPPSQAITPGLYSQTAAPPTNHNSYATQQQQQQQQQQPAANTKKSKPQQQQQHHKNTQNEYAGAAAPVKCATETCAETSTQTADITESHSAEISECSASPRKMLNIQEEESSVANETDDCDNSASNCLSVTTTTSTKSYDRIEIQKFKNQATSPNIPNSPADTEEAVAVNDIAIGRDQPSRSQYQSQTPSSFVPQQRDTPNSARSTPYSNADSNSKQRNSDESKAAPWTYTQSYQAPDGSTVFHTTNGSPYCTAATYQQGPDGSVYAIPQSMVYAYPPQLDGEVQGYFMPVFDPAHQRPEATGIIPAGAQAIYSAAGGGATVVPVAAAYPSAQFATATGAPIYPGQVLYSSEQFPGNSAAQVAGTATAGSAPGPLQQYPVTATYPIGYPYPYNGYWGQTMTTYYVPQQTLTNATPLLSAQPPTATAVSGSHLTGTALSGGAQMTNNLMLATAAAGPPSSTLPSANHNAANGSGSYLHSTGGIYNGGNIAGRGKRTTPPHQQSGPNAAHPQSNHHHHQTAAAAGITTTYQLGHALPTFTLAATPANAAAAAAAANELGNAGNATATTMYAIPQHAAAAMFPANILPYASAAAQPGAGSVLGPVAAQHHAAAHHSAVTAAGAAAAAAHAHQANTVISPLFSHPPQQLFTTQQPAGSAHAPGPSAIAIVDPASVCHSAAAVGNQQTATNAGGACVNYMGSSTPQSAPSTPHSLSTQHQQQHQRNPPLFATPPISAAGGAVNYHYYAASNEAPSYGSNANNTHSYVSTYEKRNAGSVAGKKPTYSNNNNNSSGGNNVNSSYAGRQNAANSGGYAGSHNNKALLHNSNETRSSPNTACISVSSNYQGNRPHVMHKRSNEKTTTSTSLLNGPPLATYHNTVQHNSIVEQSNKSSTPGRMNNIGGGGGGGYRQKPSSFDFRRSASQRNSPSTNSSNESNNNSPSSLVSSPPTAVTYSTSSYVNSAGSEHQAATSLYIARGPHIPPTMAPPPHGLPPSAGPPPPPGTHQAATSAILGGVAAEVAANAAAAAAAVATGHQPLLGTYNPGAPTAGVYIKYGQTYFAHPTVALPNSRRSPQSDLRPPQMAPMHGMYPAVNMMLSAPTRPVQPRHPNPNYKGTRPSR